MKLKFFFNIAIHDPTISVAATFAKQVAPECGARGPVDERLDVVMIGAGFCGLGVGAALRAHGISRFAILEQGERAGHFWTTTYERLHLHSAFHDMPQEGTSA
jgi:hypothetical protein